MACRSSGCPIFSARSCTIRDSVVWADGARPDIIDCLQGKGFPNVCAAPKGPGSVKAGVDRLQGFELVIAPACEHARAEVHGYSWPVNRLTGLVISGENPVGVNDHLLDCLRYCTTDYFPSVSLDDEEDAADPYGGVLWIPMPGIGARDPREVPWHMRVRRG